MYMQPGLCAPTKGKNGFLAPTLGMAYVVFWSLAALLTTPSAEAQSRL